MLCMQNKRTVIRGGDVKRIIAFALVSLIVLSSSVVSSQAVAAQGEGLPALVDENKGKGVGLIVGCVVFFPLGCAIGFFAGWGYDGVVGPMVAGRDR